MGETKKNFNSWRTGYAFKEAHGGGSIGGFLSAVVGSMMVLKTTPVPAMWDALIPITTATEDCRVASKKSRRRRKHRGRWSAGAGARMLRGDESFPSEA